MSQLSHSKLCFPRSVFCGVIFFGLLIATADVSIGQMSATHHRLIDQQNLFTGESKVRIKSFEPIEKGLILDLNADSGVQTEDSARVTQWENMIRDFPAQFFKYRDKGRKVPGSGRPLLKKGVGKIGGHSTLVFRRQELVNHKEDAFDHLLTGDGYTWFIVLSPYEQVVGLEDVNSFFGNLRNGGKFEGFWGGLTDENKVWIGSRNGITFGRWDKNNPKVLAAQALETKKYYLIMGRMGSGTNEVMVELFINDMKPTAVKSLPVNPSANPSKLVIGQERDAVNHPGKESFDGEIARFLLYERPLSDQEMKAMMEEMMTEYNIDD